jgi:GT2 family glycosyltransferase
VTETPTLSFTLITYNRKEDLQRAVDSILGQDYEDFEIVIVSNSTDGTEELFLGDGPYAIDEIRFFQYEGRMGVAEARNVAHRKAHGDIYVTIDDDAEFRHPDCANHIEQLFRERSDMGVLAFRVTNAYTGEVESIPHRDNAISTEKAFETTYFVGCGHAIQAEALDDAGLYPEEFVYGCEELDLAYRILDIGYEIWYDPAVEIIHKESPEARYEDRFYYQKMMENRIRLNIRNVPWRYVCIYLTVWTFYTLYLSRGDVIAVARGWWTAVQDLSALLSQRSTIDRETIERIKSQSGRLYY